MNEFIIKPSINNYIDCESKLDESIALLSHANCEYSFKINFLSSALFKLFFYLIIRQRNL